MTSDSHTDGTYKVLERVTITTPLGLRFWDVMTQRAIGDGLVVTIYPQQNRNHRLQAKPNYSGIFVFNRLPGLPDITIRESATPLPPEPLWSAPNPQSAFILEVEDQYGRFLPFQLTITELTRGVFDLICPTLSPISPPQAVPAAPLPNIPLFSSPNRLISPGIAVVRADLRQTVTTKEVGLPASWAVLSVFYKGKLVGRGLANGQGSVMVPFPYPKPTISTGPSGLLSNPVSIYEQSWEISLLAQFYSAAQVSDGLPERPNLCEALNNPHVSLLESLSPLVPLGVQTVRYAKENIIKTKPYSELCFTNP